mmetsp:Transcript_7381/g.10559  ORF Transcript_7381/g.10559 Transcript_7381/m.10559 type:complete len:109 (-) Transcript_7381:1902-2228(-)
MGWYNSPIQRQRRKYIKRRVTDNDHILFLLLHLFRGKDQNILQFVPRKSVASFQQPLFEIAAKIFDISFAKLSTSSSPFTPSCKKTFDNTNIYLICYYLCTSTNNGYI